MRDEEYLEKLKTTPIKALNFGSAAARREVMRAGIKTLPELFGLSEDEVDKRFSDKTADVVVKLQERYNADPLTLAASMLRPKDTDGARPERVPAQAVVRRDSAYVKTRDDSRPSSYRVLAPLPSAAFSDDLRFFEHRAEEVFDALDDAYENVMVYQSFEKLSIYLDEIDSAFCQLFKYYGGQPRRALRLIDERLSNVFLVYVTDRARRVYTGGNLWNNFFDGTTINDGNVQGDFKKIFIKHIERRGMPLYVPDEKKHFYFYTALLHGGLSKDAWSSLWEKSIIPLVKDGGCGEYGYLDKMNGRAVLNEIRKPDGRYAPGKAVLSVLEKAPDSTIVPLIEASLKVAEQMIDPQEVQSDYAMISTFGLPEAAMSALRENQERKTFAASGLSERAGRQARSNYRLVYLPEASLQLDLAGGVVSVRWPAQQFPMHFVGSKIDYFINGEKSTSIDFEPRAGKSVLKAVSIDVEPQGRYDVELRLMQKDDQNNAFVEIANLNQTFERSKPGCFEFIESAQGSYRLRRKNERIKKSRRVAYVVKPGYRIDSGRGMTPVSEIEAAGGWSDARIEIYDIEPGSSGAVVDVETGEEVAVWQERYTAKIDKTRIIGETADGRDLYGYVPGEHETNAGLPSVSIETVDGQAALHDLDIRCLCDEREVAIKRRTEWTDGNDGFGAGRIVLSLQESGPFDWHAKRCLLEARQKSSGGQVVFRYKFAIVPIQDFRPISLWFDHGVAFAEYGFQALTEIEVEDDQGNIERMSDWCRYQAKRLLKDEFLDLTIRSISAGKVTEARLALAAVKVKLPSRLVDISKERPVCLADALGLDLGAANLEITAKGWRYNRDVLVWFGDELLSWMDLKRQGTHVINLFQSYDRFKQRNGEPARDRLLKLVLHYGDEVYCDAADDCYRLRPAMTEVELIRCSEGIGPKDWKLVTTSTGKHVLRFKGSLLCDARFEFKRRIGGRHITTMDVDAGSSEFVLPSEVDEPLSTHREIVMNMMPLSWFGALPEYTVTSVLKRG